MALPLLGLLAATVYAGGWLPWAVKSARPEPAASAARRALPPAQRRKVLSLKLTPHGFAPASVTAPKGDYFITVHNATELDGLELRLDREPSERKAAGRVSREVLRWNEYVKLHPGEYVVTEAGHPEWTCRITVTPHDE